MRMLGIGSLSDSREGALKMISENNMKQICAAILHDQAGTTIPVKLKNGTTVHICPAVHVTRDTGDGRPTGVGESCGLWLMLVLSR